MPPSEIVRSALVSRRPVEERSVAAHFDEDDAGAGREVGRQDARVSLGDGGRVDADLHKGLAREVRLQLLDDALRDAALTDLERRVERLSRRAERSEIGRRERGHGAGSTLRNMSLRRADTLGPRMKDDG